MYNMSFRIQFGIIIALAAVLFVLCISLLSYIGLSAWSPEIMAVLWGVGTIIFFMCVSVKLLRRKNDLLMFWGSFLCKVVYMLYRYGGSPISSPNLSKDAAGFWDVALEYYSGDFGRVYTPFPYVLNAEFHVFGQNIICCIMVNIALTMMMVLTFFAILDKLQIYGRGRFWGAILVCFMPYMFILTASLLRESIYFYFITASMGSYINYILTEKHRSLYFSLLLVTPVLIMHIGYFPIVFVYLADMYTHEKINTKKQFVYKCVQLFLIVGFIVVASSFNSVSYLVGSTGGIEGIIKKLIGSTPSETTVAAGSRYLAGVEITSIGTLILYAPLKWIFYLFSPLPMNWRGLTDIISFVFDGLVHFIVIVSGLKYIKASKKAVCNPIHLKKVRICKVALWSMILCACVFGLGTGTAGTAMRHRDVMLGAEAVIIALSLSSGQNLDITQNTLIIDK